MADSPQFEAYFKLLPDQGSNPVGVALRKTWAKDAEASLPGGYYGIGDSPHDAYSAIFFNVTPASLGGIDQQLMALGGDAGTWSTFGAAMVTDTLLVVAPSTQVLMSPQGNQFGRPSLQQYRPRATSDDEQPMLSRLYAAAFTGYQLMFQAQYAAQLQPGAGNEYIARLTSPAWITAKQASVASGTWTDAAWEMFHHTIKLLAAGATAAQISAALAAIASAGLPLPPEVSAGAWPGYRGFIGSPVLAISDFQADGMPGLLTPIYKSSYSPKGNFGSTVPEGIAQSFVQTTPYWWNPGGSCLLPTTRVLLPGGADRALGEIQPGDEVWTPSGPAPVRVVARVARQRRPLFHLNGSAMAFSDSHPFVDGSTGGSLAVQLARAAAFAPGLGHLGLGRLEAGAAVVQVDRAGNQAPRAVESVIYDSTSGDDELVDLILQPTETGFPSYAVGDGAAGGFYLIRSEVPRFEAHPFGTLAGVQLLAGSVETAGAALASLTPEAIPRLDTAIRDIVPLLVSDALAATEPAEASRTSAAPSAPVHEQLSAVLAAFHGTGPFNWQLGSLQESLAHHLLVPLDHVVRSGWRPFNPAPSPSCGVALTIHDVVAERDLDLAGDWSLVASLEGAPTRTIPLAPRRVSHHRPVGLTVIRLAPLSAQLCPLTVRLTSPGGDQLMGQGVVPPPASGFVSAAVPLSRKPGEAPAATVRFDVRALPPDVLAAHPDQPPADWDERAQLDFAHRLGRALAAAFAERFPAALAAHGSASG
jgi:hypothetical protein